MGYFFDMIGLKYEYEVEGFEIKAKPLSEYEMKKCEDFCFNKDNENIKFSVLIGSPEAVKIDDFSGVLEYVWEWPSEIVPNVTEEELNVAATASREARFEFGESPQVKKQLLMEGDKSCMY